jgi:hypothetical protein
MWRPPSIDPKREKELSGLKRILAGLEAIPDHHREDELADLRAEMVRKMIAELESLR